MGFGSLRVVGGDSPQSLCLFDDIFLSHVRLSCLVSRRPQHVLERLCTTNCIWSHNCILLGCQLPLSPGTAKLFYQPKPQVTMLSGA